MFLKKFKPQNMSQNSIFWLKILLNSKIVLFSNQFCNCSIVWINWKKKVKDCWCGLIATSRSRRCRRRWSNSRKKIHSDFLRLEVSSPKNIHTPSQEGGIAAFLKEKRKIFFPSNFSNQFFHLQFNKSKKRYDAAKVEMKNLFDQLEDLMGYTDPSRSGYGMADDWVMKNLPSTVSLYWLI